MSYEEWIKHCEKVILQYNEGAIFAGEAFNSIINKALEVKQINFCFTCGLEIETDCKCEVRVSD